MDINPFDEWYAEAAIAAAGALAVAVGWIARKIFGKKPEPTSLKIRK